MPSALGVRSERLAPPLRAAGGDWKIRGMSQSVASRMTRNKMRADWDTVRAMLTDPKAPPRDAQGRDVFEVWADMVLVNPAAEYARVARDILPTEVTDSGVSNEVVTNIQSLYLTAVQQANRDPDPRVVEVMAEKDEWWAYSARRAYQVLTGESLHGIRH
jgi:hypothetical protein